MISKHVLKTVNNKWLLTKLIEEVGKRESVEKIKQLEDEILSRMTNKKIEVEE